MEEERITRPKILSYIEGIMMTSFSSVMIMIMMAYQYITIHRLGCIQSP